MSVKPLAFAGLVLLGSFAGGIVSQCLLTSNRSAEAAPPSRIDLDAEAKANETWYKFLSHMDWKYGAQHRETATAAAKTHLARQGFTTARPPSDEAALARIELEYRRLVEEIRKTRRQALLAKGIRRYQLALWQANYFLTDQITGDVYCLRKSGRTPVEGRWVLLADGPPEIK